MLFLVATPIGHLDDISKRAIQTLQECDLILCEDTRRSAILLQKYQIEKPLLPYHQFNEVASHEKILKELQQGKQLALISDAGTPCINDPGQRLVALCIENKIPFTSIPGPCSIIQALLLSGFDSTRFQFVGFLPKANSELLRSLLYYPGTTIAFESPNRLIGTLKSILVLDPNRQIAVAREMTKTFEECLRGTAHELIDHFEKRKVKGEIVLVISQGKMKEEEMSLEELVEMLQQLHGLSLKEAIKQAAKLTNTPKSSIYKKMHFLS